MRRPGVWAIVVSAVACGQTLKLTQSDGGPSFLTAGERVRLTLQVEGQSLLGGGCRLAYSPLQALSFAGWTPADFSQRQTLVVAGVDTAAGEGWVDIGALSLERARDTLRLVTLEFAVAFEAAHGSTVQFRAFQGWALGVDSLHKLGTVTLALPVHGIVEVWPGDANDDGVVDARDVAVVGLYAYREASGPRRVPASTEWLPQRVRAWAEPVATYADCDGNGVVTVRDLAVVLQNYGMSRNGTSVRAKPPVLPVLTGSCLLRGYIPPEATVVVGVCIPCAGGNITGVQHTGAASVVGSGDWLYAFVFASPGEGMLELFGEGTICWTQIEYRTPLGEWRRVELSGLEVAQPEIAPLRLGLEEGQVWVEGWRQSSGWLRILTLLGQEVVRLSVPAGVGRWSADVPALGTAPYVLLYQAASGVRYAAVRVSGLHRR